MKSNSKANYLKLFKPILVASLILVLLATVIVAVFNFNLGFDFSGGRQLVVQFELTDIKIYDNAEKDKAADKIRDILMKKGADINSFQVQGEYDTTYFQITFRGVDDKKLDEIRLEINKTYNTSSEYTGLENKEDILNKPQDLTKVTEIASFIPSGSIFTTIYTLVFALVLIVLYACFRVKVGGAITILLGAVYDILLTIAAFGLLRLPLTRYTFVVLALVLMYSIYSTCTLLYKIKDYTKDIHFNDKTNYELANMATNEKVNDKSFILLIILLMLVYFTNAWQTANLAVTGIVIVFLSHLCVVPGIFTMLNKKREIVYATQLNNKDKSAKVIEVKEEKKDGV